MNTYAEDDPSHRPGHDEAPGAGAPAVDADDLLVRRLIAGLGFCGHYLHFHGGGMSGRL